MCLIIQTQSTALQLPDNNSEAGSDAVITVAYGIIICSPKSGFCDIH